jgi:hypothetical protein
MATVEFFCKVWQFLKKDDENLPNISKLQLQGELEERGRKRQKEVRENKE